MARPQMLFLALILASSWMLCTTEENKTGKHAFDWKFSNTMISRDLTQCKAYGIIILALPDNSSSFGTPPYYMIAWKPRGIPTVSLIGSDRNNLSWTVNQASGSSLLLTVADSQGFSGGEPDHLFNVFGWSIPLYTLLQLADRNAEDGNQSCLPSPPLTNITLAANISESDTLKTCEPLGLRVFGGQKPYTVSLAALNLPVVTNVTFGSDDDVLTWPNRADPNGRILAAVSDANGIWGTGTRLFNTTGQPAQPDPCKGNPSTENSADVDQHPKQPSNSHAAVIAGVIVPVVVVCFLGGLLYYLWRKRQQKLREPEPAFLPDAWMVPSRTELETGGASTYSPYDSSPSAKLARYRAEMSVSHSRTSLNQNATEIGSLGQRMPRIVQQSTFDGHSGPTSVSDSYSHTGSVGDGKRNRRLPPGISSEWIIEPEIVKQHEDAGDVQEIPPPYRDRSAAVQFSGPAEHPSSSRLSVMDSSTMTSRSSSPDDQYAGSSAPLHPTPVLNKGKGKEIDLLI